MEKYTSAVLRERYKGIQQPMSDEMTENPGNQQPMSDKYEV